MKYYMAPLEGITTYNFRSAYAKYFSEIDTYFTPFIASKKLSSKEKNEILPEHNIGITLVPQILTNRVDEFLSIAEKIADYGYDTVNLNLGCPSGTVAAKHRGAGFLDVPNQLDAFLDEIFTKCPLKISIKTRIGISEEEEWPRLLSIYQKYPIFELIIHVRLLDDFYKGAPRTHAYGVAKELISCPLCYNGDIVSVQTKDALLAQYPDIDRIMIGRGLLAKPWLMSELNGTPTPSKQTLIDFHNELLERYIAIMPGEDPVLFKMKDVWTYLSKSFPEPEKTLKKIRKSSRISEFKIAAAHAFSELDSLQ